MLDLTEARYEAVSEVAVKVSHSAFHLAKTYTNKLEGAELVGYQSVLIGSVRDPFIIRQIDNWLERVLVKIHDRVASVFGAKLPRKDYDIHVRVYGRNGTMGPQSRAGDPLARVTAAVRDDRAQPGHCQHAR